MTEKTDHIEEVLAHQERQISDLSEMIIRQGRDIDALKSYLRKLEYKLDLLEDGDMEEDKPASLIEEAARNKPPHY